MKDRVWSVLNVSLGLISIVLLFNFIGIDLPNFGKAVYSLDGQAPVCLLEGSTTTTTKEINLDVCCLEARKQLECQPQRRSVQGSQVDWVCSSGSYSSIQYRLNNKAYHYCQQQPIWK